MNSESQTATVHQVQSCTGGPLHGLYRVGEVTRSPAEDGQLWTIRLDDWTGSVRCRLRLAQDAALPLISSVIDADLHVRSFGGKHVVEIKAWRSAVLHGIRNGAALLPFADIREQGEPLSALVHLNERICPEPLRQFVSRIFLDDRIGRPLLFRVVRRLPPEMSLSLPRRLRQASDNPKQL